MAKKFATFDESGALLLRFDSAVNDIPSNAVEIETALWARLVTESAGLWRLSGNTVIKEPLPEIPLEVLGAHERAWRDAKMQATEWLVNRHRDELDLGRPTTLTADLFAELLAYRKDLRDWPQSPNFPDAQERPKEPKWLSNTQEGDQ